MYVRNNQPRNRPFGNQGRGRETFNQRMFKRRNRSQPRGYANREFIQPRENSTETRPNTFQNRGIECYNCGKYGHMQRNCWAKPRAGYANYSKNWKGSN